MSLAEHPRAYALGPISVWLCGWYWSIRFGRRLSIVLYPHGNPQISPKPHRKLHGAQEPWNAVVAAKTRVVP